MPLRFQVRIVDSCCINEIDNGMRVHCVIMFGNGQKEVPGGTIHVNMAWNWKVWLPGIESNP